MNKTIIVALPCFNEAATIMKVVADFKSVLPNAGVHVFDNNSSDGSAALAAAAGAQVHSVPQQGKGYVVRAMLETFQDVDALVMVDSDDTYEAQDVLTLLAPVLAGRADMVIGNRLPSATDESMVRLHQWGNWAIVTAINWMFNADFQDILSGYRVFSRRFLETVPVLSEGFEIETELTVQALEEGLVVIDLPVQYRSRPEGSHSKLQSFRDGYRIITTAISLLRDHRPMVLYGLAGTLTGLVAFLGGVLRIFNYLTVTALPDALLTGIILLFAPMAVMLFGIGLMLHTVNVRMRQLKQIVQRKQQNHDR
jgi:glycosyltransferase involved in cell wall biosynthesis